MSLTEQMRRADEREHRKRLKDRIARPSIVDAIADGMAQQDAGRVITAAEHACMDAIERACETDASN